MDDRPFAHLSDADLTVRLNRSYGGARYCQEVLDRLTALRAAVDATPPTRGHAEAIRVESDECGFELHVDTSDGDRYVFNVHAVAWDFAADVDATIGAWRREGEDVRATMRQAAAIAAAEGGYDRSDPKHPDWHSTHADVYDLRERGPS